jgi:hypothetical protein
VQIQEWVGMTVAATVSRVSEAGRRSTEEARGSTSQPAEPLYELVEKPISVGSYLYATAALAGPASGKRSVLRKPAFRHQPSNWA